MPRTPDHTRVSIRSLVRSQRTTSRISLLAVTVHVACACKAVLSGVHSFLSTACGKRSGTVFSLKVLTCSVRVAVPWGVRVASHGVGYEDGVPWGVVVEMSVKSSQVKVLTRKKVVEMRAMR
jgi:hypothetical protein